MHVSFVWRAVKSDGRKKVCKVAHNSDNTFLSKIEPVAVLWLWAWHEKRGQAKDQFC